MIDIRQAEETDVKALCAFDPIARIERQRREFIHHSVRDGIAYVALADGHVVGYSVLEHSFFARGFIAMLLVQPDYRRSGIGSALVRHVETVCKSGRIFTSANQSNQSMQALLQKLGYTRSGVVDDLDPGDSELLYSRELRKQTTGEST